MKILLVTLRLGPRSRRCVPLIPRSGLGHGDPRRRRGAALLRLAISGPGNARLVFLSRPLHEEPRPSAALVASAASLFLLGVARWPKREAPGSSSRRGVHRFGLEALRVPRRALKKFRRCSSRTSSASFRRDPGPCGPCARRCGLDAHAPGVRRVWVPTFRPTAPAGFLPLSGSRPRASGRGPLIYPLCRFGRMICRGTAFRWWRAQPSAIDVLALLSGPEPRRWCWASGGSRLREPSSTR